VLPLADYPWRGGGPIEVGHDVWIGTGALILPGVTIGQGAVIGARAVVARAIPALVRGDVAALTRA
jgi:acetyltransferase-like isoleucine patch superfamily enzyme